MNTGPILMALLAARLLGEALPPRLLSGMAVSFVGAVVVGLSMSSGGGSASVLGVVLCLLAAVAYATGVVSQKPALSFGTPLQITAYSCMTGALACLPFAGQLATELPRAPISATLNMIYLGVVPTALAFITWTYALARTPMRQAGRDDLRRARHRGPAELGPAGRGARLADFARRSALPGRGRGLPLPAPHGHPVATGRPRTGRA